MKDNLDGTVDFQVRVSCSSGTYVRTLAEDFGKRLNVGAHLAELRRTRVGGFSIKDAVTLDELQVRFAEEAIGTVLLPPRAALSHLPFLHLSGDDARKASPGMEVTVTGSEWSDGAEVGMCDSEGTLLAVGRFDADKGRLHPHVVLAPSE